MSPPSLGIFKCLPFLVFCLFDRDLSIYPFERGFLQRETKTCDLKHT